MTTIQIPDNPTPDEVARALRLLANKLDLKVNHDGIGTAQGTGGRDENLHGPDFLVQDPGPADPEAG